MPVMCGHTMSVSKVLKLLGFRECPWAYISHLPRVAGRGISRLFAGPPALDEEAEGLSFGFFTPARCSGGVPDIRQQCLGGVDALLGAGLRVVHHGEQELSGVGEFAAQG